MSNVTHLLQAVERGESGAAEELLPMVYEELRRLAVTRMARERPGQTLQPTALVHEAWMRLGGDQQPAWKNRAHFFAAAAEAMRRILVEKARSRASQKRGGDWDRVELDSCEIAAPMPPEELLALDEALTELGRLNPRHARLVELCFFVGLTQRGAAEALGISVATAERDWAFCRAWLHRRIRRPNEVALESP